MKKLYIIQLVLFSIVFSSWNNPYINTTETLQLEYGMPTNIDEDTILDREWNEKAAQMQLLKFFEAWGFADPVTAEKRKDLSAILFS